MNVNQYFFTAGAVLLDNIFHIKNAFDKIADVYEKKHSSYTYIVPRLYEKRTIFSSTTQGKRLYKE